VSDTTEFNHSLYVASLIEKYLQSHPEAMDSFDGIKSWWITQQKLQESAYSVSHALDILIQKGIVEQVHDDLYRYSAS
jgi:hypothetical protein